MSLIIQWNKKKLFLPDSKKRKYFPIVLYETDNVRNKIQCCKLLSLERHIRLYKLTKESDFFIGKWQLSKGKI
jgi:hypothetical protein